MVMLEVGASAGADQAGPADATSSLGTVVLSSIAPGYRVTSHGSLDASRFASGAPDPAAAAGALATLEQSVPTYQRVWQADGGRNEVQDALVRFPDEVRAESFLQAAQHALESGEIVSSDPLPSVPGARRVTYFAAARHDGVGQAITTRAGVYVDLLSLVSVAAGNAHPISPASAERLAVAQHAAMARAPGGGATGSPSGGSKRGASAGTIALAVVVVAIASAAVAAPGLLRRRRLAQEAATTGRPLHTAPSPGSAGDAIDDLREHRG
jgi:hypothetical protein